MKVGWEAHELQAIWRAGVTSVLSDRLVREAVTADWQANRLRCGELEWQAAADSRIVVVGAGKAGAGMASGFEQALGPRALAHWQVSGIVNVPDNTVSGNTVSGNTVSGNTVSGNTVSGNTVSGNTVSKNTVPGNTAPGSPAKPLVAIRLHGARPASSNEPTAAGVWGAERMLEMVAALRPQDLCVVLLSGGGSALLPLPAPGISLADKLAVTRQLSAGGASIHQLNRVRRQLSRIKGGGLARSCRAGTLVALIISDVMSNDLETIASGPTVVPSLDAASLVGRDARQRELHACRQIWTDLGLDWSAVPLAVQRRLDPEQVGDLEERLVTAGTAGPARVVHQIIGENATAVSAAANHARNLGYSVRTLSPESSQTTADEVGRRCAELLAEMVDATEPQCIVWGGEPVVRLAPAAERGLGGRNQQVVLAAALELLRGGTQFPSEPGGAGLLSGGTDGEDGPTAAAGAMLDRSALAAVERDLPAAQTALDRNDAYRFWEARTTASGEPALLVTGPTDTNVGDVRVLITRPAS